MLVNQNPKGRPIIYDDVPAQFKPPFNMQWKQVPPGYDFAGCWMYDSPFETGLPWESLGKAEIPQVDIVLGGPPKPGFIETHGEMPTDATDRRIWKDAHQWFKSAGLPKELAEPEILAMIDNSNSVGAAWGLTDGKIYVGRYGVMVRFPHSLKFDFEVGLSLWIHVHYAIPTYQMDCWTYKGIMPLKWHPGVPDSFIENAKKGIR